MSDFFDPEEETTKRIHNVPHWQQDQKWIFVTWRLADSLPQSKLQQWEDERDIWLKQHPEPWDEQTELAYLERFSQAIDLWLDAGHGSCLLQFKNNSKIVSDALHFFDEDRYELGRFVVMPNHVHLLFRPLGNHQLSDLLHTWKRHTSREINKRESRKGTLWQADYWDRLIRSQEHFDWVLNYIAKNPEKLPEGTYHLW